SRLDLSPQGSMDWSKLFQLQEDRFTPLVVSDIPQLAHALKKIALRALEDKELLHGLSVIAPFYNTDEERIKQIQFEMLSSLIGRILNRADSIGAETVDELQEIYKELERPLFAQELEGDVLVPLVAVSFDLSEPI